MSIYIVVVVVFELGLIVGLIVVGVIIGFGLV